MKGDALMSRPFRTMIAIVATLTLLGAACAQDDGTGAGEALELAVGQVLPLTGTLSDFGPPLARAAELGKEVFEEAASAAGLDFTIVITQEDSQTDPQAGVEAARKLVDTDGVQVILGAAASSVTIPIAESVTIPKRVVQISCCSTSGVITDLEDDGFVNRTPPSDEHQAPILAAEVAEAFGQNATISLGARNDDYGNYIIGEVAKALDALGVETTNPVLWDPEAATYDSEAAQIVSGGPDGWVLVDFPGTWHKMGPALVRTGGWDVARTFSADGLKSPFLVEDAPRGAGAEAAEGMRGTAPAGTNDFDSLWQERVGDEVGRGAFDSHGFDGLVIAALAAVAAGSTDGPDIRDHLQAVSAPPGTKYGFNDLEQAIRDLLAGEDIDYDGASGPIDLDENGDPASIGAIYDLWQIKDGQMTSIEVFVVGQDS